MDQSQNVGVALPHLCNNTKFSSRSYSVGLALPTSTATQNGVIVLMDQTQDVGLALPNFTSTATQTTVPVFMHQTGNVGFQTLAVQHHQVEFGTHINEGKTAPLIALHSSGAV